jgi:hypothetical protein
MLLCLKGTAVTTPVRDILEKHEYKNSHPLSLKLKERNGSVNVS